MVAHLGSSNILIAVKNLKKYFPVATGFFRKPQKFIKAVDDVTFDVVRGETLALVGESGSGKTTTARLMLRLLEPTGGTVFFEGKDIFRLGKHEIRQLRPRLQIIFQDPLASLNPRRTVKQTLEQPFKLHTDLSNGQILKRVIDLLQSVGLSPPDTFLDRFPHELSGGQRQRVCIARAIALKPAFVAADEPVSALDVSIRGQILNLLKELQRKLEITYLFISHDLAVVRSIADRVAVMYLGGIVEIGDVSEIFKLPLHPYTQALLSAVPIPNPEAAKKRGRIILPGEVPSPINPPTGCAFHPRCPYAMDICKWVKPSLKQINARLVACHLYS